MKRLDEPKTDIHPLILAARALEAEAVKPKNKKYRKSMLEAATHYRAEAIRLPNIDCKAGGP